MTLKSSSVDFGSGIAFVAPGFVAFHALYYHMPTAKDWMDAASGREQGVGIFLLVLLASISLGLVVSGVRALVIDNLLRSCCILRQYAVPELKLDWSKVDEKCLPILLTIRDGYYRHYQFYSNTSIALVLWVLARASTGEPNLQWQPWVFLPAVVFALLLSARSSLLRYVGAVEEMLKTK